MMYKNHSILIAITMFLIFHLSGVAQNDGITLFASGLTSPLALEHAGDKRLFVVEKGGRIKIIQPDGSINSTNFLNISNQISASGEMGLLGLAFHPNYENNGYFFVNYIDTEGNTQISRFSVNPSNPDVADPTSEFFILEIEQPFETHNGGSMAFGPDGYLYLPTGDGGSGGDPGNRAQSLNTLLGKVLRIDIDNPSGGKNYGIPADNPYVGNPDALDEIWSYGLRSPWKFSIDATENSIWIADVGQTSWEEINEVDLSEPSVNYGWRCYEGNHPFNQTGCPPESELTFPVFDYSSQPPTSNCSVTGGYVYRGSQYPSMQGIYFFADYCSGLIGTLDSDYNYTDRGSFPGNWVSFGQNYENELYVVSITGSIYSINEDILHISEKTLPKLSLFPNPAGEFVQLQAENDLLTYVEILDIRGSVLISSEALSSNTVTIETATLSEGLYLVRASTQAGAHLTEKLLIQ